MITLFATVVQIPIRVAVTYLLLGRFGVQAVAIGTAIGWCFMILYQLISYRRVRPAESRL